MDYTTKIMSVEQDKADVVRVIVVKPKGYQYSAGKLVPVSLRKPGLEDRKKAMPVMSTESDYYLEIMFKEPSRIDKFSESMMKLKAGEEIVISNYVGNLEFKGKGVFIASSLGIVPFVSIFRHLKQQESIDGNTLIYLDKSKDEMINERELRHLLDRKGHFLVTKNSGFGYEMRKLDESFLRDKGIDMNQEFYVCGNESFVSSVRQLLAPLGARITSEIVE